MDAHPGKRLRLVFWLFSLLVHGAAIGWLLGVRYEIPVWHEPSPPVEVVLGGPGRLIVAVDSPRKPKISGYSRLSRSGRSSRPVSHPPRAQGNVGEPRSVGLDDAVASRKDQEVEFALPGPGRGAGSDPVAGAGPLPPSMFPSPLSGRDGRGAGGAPTSVERAIRLTERRADLLRRWAGRVVAGIDRRWQLPVESRRGTFGTVGLSATFDANGTLEKAAVVRSSGHPALDRAALAALVPGTRFDPPPAVDLLDGPIQVTLVFRYQT